MSNEPENTIVPGWETPEDAALERDLTATMRPLRLPEGFTDRVLAQVQVQEQIKDLAMRPARPRARVIPFRAWRLVGGAAIAATLVGGVFAAQDVRERHEREQRQAIATQQFETATRITDQVLAHTRDELERSGALRGN